MHLQNLFKHLKYISWDPIPKQPTKLPDENTTPIQAAKANTKAELKRALKTVLQTGLLAALALAPGRSMIEFLIKGIGGVLCSKSVYDMCSSILDTIKNRYKEIKIAKLNENAYSKEQYYEESKKIILGKKEYKRRHDAELLYTWSGENKLEDAKASTKTELAQNNASIKRKFPKTKEGRREELLNVTIGRICEKLRQTAYYENRLPLISDKNHLEKELEVYKNYFQALKEESSEETERLKGLMGNFSDNDAIIAKYAKPPRLIDKLFKKNHSF